MNGLTVGRIVHYVQPSDKCKGDHIAATVVSVWDSEEGVVQLSCFPDSVNNSQEFSEPVVAATSVLYSEEKTEGTWHWIERA